MLSLNSIKNYLLINSSLLLFSYIQYKFIIKYNSFINLFGIFFFRNILMERLMWYGLKNKPYIGEIDRNNKVKYDIKIIMLFLVSSTFIETLTHYYISSYYIYLPTNIIKDLIWFIPISFIYEIIFDLGHYIAHRIEHTNKFLYKYVHKVHHTYSAPISILTHYHHPLDLILSNTLPQILALGIIPQISQFTFSMLVIYKIFIEISGHTGKIINSSCFPQLMWGPRILGIELYTEDHDTHHKLNNCNYAKRFKLWDLIFHTYKMEENNTI